MLVTDAGLVGRITHMPLNTENRNCRSTIAINSSIAARRGA